MYMLSAVLWGSVKNDRQTPRELMEIPVRSEDGKVLPHGDGADQEIRV